LNNVRLWRPQSSHAHKSCGSPTWAANGSGNVGAFNGNLHTGFCNGNGNLGSFNGNLNGGSLNGNVGFANGNLNGDGNH
jgi:hypothetical protein